MAGGDPRFVSRFDWERAVRDADLPWPTKAVCLLLGTYMDGDTGATFVSVSTLSAAAGLARSGVLRHLAAAEAGGLLIASRQPGRKTNRRAVLLTNRSHQQDRSEPRPVPPAGPDRSHQQDHPVPPVGPDPSHQRDPIKHLSLMDQAAISGRDAESPVIIEPADRDPRSDDALAEACRLAGAPWTLGDVTSGRRLLAKAYGDDARAAGAADAALKHLADRPAGQQVQRLGAFLRKLEQDGELDSLRVVAPTDLPQVPRLGCPECAGHPSGHGWVGDLDRPQPCSCRLAAQASRRSA